PFRRDLERRAVNMDVRWRPYHLFEANRVVKPIESNGKPFLETSNDLTYATPNGKPRSDLGFNVRRDGGAGRGHVNHKAADGRPVGQDQVCMRVFRNDPLLS